MEFTSQDYFLALMGAANALWSWRLFMVLNKLDTKLARMEGLYTGENLDERVTNLERELAHHKYAEGGHHARS